MVKGTAYPVDTQTLGKYIQIWYGLIIGTVGILASIMIMYGGFKWLTSRGGQAVSEARILFFRPDRADTGFSFLYHLVSGQSQSLKDRFAG